MGVKHLILTRMWVICSQLGRAGKYGFASWSCAWPRHGNSCLKTYSSLPGFNRLMSAVGRGQSVVIVSATWRQVRTTEDCQRREPSLTEGQVTWLPVRGDNRPWSKPILEVQRTQPEGTWTWKRRWQLPFIEHLLCARHYARSGYVLSFNPSKSPILQKKKLSQKEKTDQNQERGTTQIPKNSEGKVLGVSCQEIFKNLSSLWP